ncbi:MAG: CDP-glycerol glycerophosphotransferase family protein, partial [Clostridiales bacterium]|nr:CDP-glycerol glycerophosphotransferase family protein [Clostridiales bacterium]
YLSGYLLVSRHSRVLLEKVFLRIVKFREEGKQYSFDVVTSPIDDQEKFKRFKKKYYVEFWRQEIVRFSTVIDIEKIKLEKGFFKLFIEYNGHFANIKNYDKELQEKDHCYPIQLPFFKEAFIVPYCDDVVNTWRLDIYHFNLFERMKLRHLFEKYSEGSLPEKDPNTWLIGEYQNTARDNGMYFFQYLRTMHPTINAYYVIYDDSPDKKKLNDSHVISYGSYRHFAVSVKAKVLVFSHAANFLIPKIDELVSYKNKYQAYHTIFIQHGIIATTAHALIYRKKLREYDRFVVSSSLEKEIIHKHLGYAEKNIIVTGLARWDKLLSISTKTTDILIMPTWRNDLNNVSADIFKQSDFFKFWNSLLTNDDFLYLIRKKNITVKFFLHFALSRFANCFNFPTEITQINDDSIQTLLGSCGLLVTDYSSVAFDVLLQNKPVIFAPFDYKKMVVLRKGTPFIDYEKDLPGPVCYNVNTTFESIKKHIANGYTIEPEYRERRENFFTYIDRHNSDRIFLEINKLISS